MMGVLLCVGVFFLTAVSSFYQLAHPNNNDAFLQNEVASVYISIAPEDIETILTDSLLSDHEYPLHLNTSLPFSRIRWNWLDSGLGEIRPDMLPKNHLRSHLIPLFPVRNGMVWRK